MDCRPAILGALLTLAAALPAAAQSPAPAPAPMAPTTTPPPAAAAPTIRSGSASAAGVDARNCLEFPTNRQIILCAEKYLPGRRNG